MKVNIKLSSSFSKKLQSGIIEFSGITIEDALVALGMDIEEVGFVLRDEKICPLDTVLAEGDSLEVYPNIIGG